MIPLTGVLAQQAMTGPGPTIQRKLRVIHSAIGEITFAVADRKMVLGRAGEGVDVELNWDPRVSRRHGCVWAAGGHVWFEDLGSRNGSWIGESRLSTPVRLDAGISVLLGETVISLAESSPMELVEATIPGFDTMPPPAGASEKPLGTQDLRAFVAPPPAATTAVQIRGPARIVLAAPDRADVLIDDRAQLRELWTRELSKGALFVPTETPPPLGRAIELRLLCEHGTVSMPASVVHVVERASGAQPAGAGLSITGMTGELRHAIQAYANSLAQRLEISAKPQPAAPAADAELRRVKQFLELVERNDLYTALDVPPNAHESKIQQRIHQLRASFAASKSTVAAPVAARIDRAIQVLNRVEPKLTDPMQRLHYDFRTGNVRAEERLRQAANRSGPSIGELRRAWNTASPESVDRAAFLTRQAFSARQRGAVAEAIAAAKQALEHNPFFDELRQSVKAWEELAKKR